MTLMLDVLGGKCREMLVCGVFAIVKIGAQGRFDAFGCFDLFLGPGPAEMTFFLLCFVRSIIGSCFNVSKLVRSRHLVGTQYINVFVSTITGSHFFLLLFIGAHGKTTSEATCPRSVAIYSTCYHERGDRKKPYCFDLI